MRRYLVPTMYSHFDSTPIDLAETVRDEWPEHIKLQHLRNRRRRLSELARNFGWRDIERKCADFAALGPIHPSVISYHNVFYEQARNAFTRGDYYPALTSACSLGERILNHLVLDLREAFADTPHYRDLRGGPRFTKWPIMIRALKNSGVLIPEVARSFRKLARIRHRSIHFSNETYVQVREDALAAVHH